MPVKLLIDENLAPRLAGDLTEFFPGSRHIRDISLQAASDEDVWKAAAADAFVIVTKDDDFRQRSFLRGHPPKVIWIPVGNCRTFEVAALFRARCGEVEDFVGDPDTALLLISRR